MILKSVSAATICLATGMCGGGMQGEMTQTGPGGTTTYKLGGEWHKNPATGSLSVNLNPPATGTTPAGSYAMVMKDNDGNVVKTLEVVMPAIQAGSGTTTVTATATDPWVVQIPQDWHLKSIDYTSPAGTEKATITEGAVPWNLVITPSGPVATDFYLAEPGYKTYLVEVPESILVSGRHSAVAYVECGLAARRMDTVKVIETGIMTVAGSSTRAFFPLNGNVHDFSVYSDLFLTFDVELSGPQCSGPSGHQPRFSLDDCYGWQTNSVGTLEIHGLDLAAPAVYMIGGFTYLNPGIPLPGFGCLSNVSLDSSTPLTVNSQGEATITLAVANDPSLVGTTLYWQAAQLYGDGSLLSSDVFKTVVESGQ